MERRTKRALLAMATIAGVLALAWWRPWRAPVPAKGAATATATMVGSTIATPATTATSRAIPTASATASAHPAPFATMRWGSGPRDLGRKRPQEGNPEAPMSFAMAPGGDALVLDQVNGRLVRFGPDGAPRGTIKVGDGAQDVAVGRDGAVAVLDRLVDKSIALYGADGRSLGSLQLVGKGITEGGQVTGVFVDGTTVYAEREHGQLVRIGDTKGDATGAGEEIPGRPTRDGSSYVSAFLEGGRAFVSATARATMQHRYTRALALPGAARGILLLDSDRFSTVYVAVLGSAADVEHEWLACVALEDGRVLGVVPVTPNTLPEETFREFAVLDDGGVLHAEMSEDGITYARYDCR